MAYANGNIVCDGFGTYGAEDAVGARFCYRAVALNSAWGMQMETSSAMGSAPTLNSAWRMQMETSSAMGSVPTGVDVVCLQKALITAIMRKQ